MLIQAFQFSHITSGKSQKFAPPLLIFAFLVFIISNKIPYTLWYQTPCFLIFIENLDPQFFSSFPI